MKSLVALLVVAFAGVAFAAEEKKVCIDTIGKDGKPVLDAKTKAPKQTCKTVKVHKKLEGHEVPGQKK